MIINLEISNRNRESALFAYDSETDLLRNEEECTFDWAEGAVFLAMLLADCRSLAHSEYGMGESSITVDGERYYIDFAKEN